MIIGLRSRNQRIYWHPTVDRRHYSWLFKLKIKKTKQTTIPCSWGKFQDISILKNIPQTDTRETSKKIYCVTVFVNVFHFKMYYLRVWEMSYTDKTKLCSLSFEHIYSTWYYNLKVYICLYFWTLWTKTQRCILNYISINFSVW